MLEFDKKGFLVPDQSLACSLDEMRRVFVEEFPASGTRLALFENFTEYCRELMVKTNMEMLLIWVGGSFVTQKARPNDVDVVVFLESSIIDQYETALKSAFKFPASKEKYKVDAYIIRVYPEYNRNFALTQSDRLDWLNFWTKTAPNGAGVRNKKGFLEINIRYDEIKI